MLACSLRLGCSCLQIAIPEAIRRSGHITYNGSEADFFLVHAYLYCARVNIPPAGEATVFALPSSATGLLHNNVMTPMTKAPCIIGSSN